jgi:ParB family transcriptional regulator, chromosome partitioning protein
MRLEPHQIELRYQDVRISHPPQEARLTASVLAEGQRHPVLVFRDGDRYVLVDGYRRVRALGTLRRDVVLALDLDCDEPEALLRAWRGSVGRRFEAIEEAWMLRDLVHAHGVLQRELAVRMGRTVSWISRRLALVDVLPEDVQRRLQRGEVCAHAAQKVLVPLARANPKGCSRFVETIAAERLSTRQMAQWWQAWRSADAEGRERLIREPMLYLRSVAALDRHVAAPKETPEGRAAATLASVASICWRSRTVLERLLREHPELRAHPSVRGGADAAQRAWCALWKSLEVLDAGYGHTGGDPEAHG